MQQQTSIYIPKPCHEDWNKMTPTQQGKFCSACSKQVIDFSLMSDNQILNVISNQSGKLCGRFDAEQLQRPLIETKIKKKKSWWMALTMPLLFLFDKSEAQKVKVVGDTTYQTIVSKGLGIKRKHKKDLCTYETLQPTTGMIAYILNKQIIIQGKVVDENNNPLAFASVTQKGTVHGSITDSLGKFSLNVLSYDDSVTLTTSYTGFSSADKRIKIFDTNINDVVISLKEQSIGLSEVIVTGYGSAKGKFMLGGAIASCSKITILQKIDSSFKKAIGISNVYPNPATKASLIHIKIKNTGSYQMQLLDNQSRLIQSDEINVDAKNTTTQIQLQSNIAVGMYYLRLINEQTKKQYTEKLIIQ